MKSTITIGKKRGTAQWSILLGPQYSVKDHRLFLKRMRLAGSSVYDEVMVTVPIRKVRFRNDPNSKAAFSNGGRPKVAAIEAVKKAAVATAAKARTFAGRFGVGKVGA